MVPALTAWRISSGVISRSSRYFSSSFSSASAATSSILPRRFVGLAEHVRGDFRRVPHPAVVAPPKVSLHLNQVDHAHEVGLTTDRDLQDEGIGLEAIDDRLDVGVEVGPGAVEFVDEADARNLVAVGLAPDGFGLGLDAGDAVEDRHRPVENPEAALNFDREVDMAGSIDDVDVVFVPDTGGGGRGDRDPPLLLLLHPVHRGGAFVDFTDLVVATGVIEDALGKSRLARVDVSHDPDISGSAQGNLTQVRERALVVAHLNDSSGRYSVVRTAVTSGSGRRPCWTPPSCECLPCA